MFPGFHPNEPVDLSGFVWERSENMARIGGCFQIPRTHNCQHSGLTLGNPMKSVLAMAHQGVERVTGLPIKNLMRRPTVIVRHGGDWTYCLTLPRNHSSFSIPSLRLYELIHQAIGLALAKQDVATSLQPCPACKPMEFREIAEEPVGKDLMTENGKVKLAGAAMKKSKKAVLVQGTIDLSSIPSLILSHSRTIWLGRCRTLPKKRPRPLNGLKVSYPNVIYLQESSPHWVAARPKTSLNFI